MKPAEDDIDISKLQVLIDRMHSISSNKDHPVTIVVQLLDEAVQLASRDQDPAVRMILSGTLKSCLEQIQTPNLNELIDPHETVQ